MIYLAGGVNAAGAAQDPITASGVTATRAWTRTKNGADYSFVVAHGTWGSGTLIVEHEAATGIWITMATFSANGGQVKQLPNGNYRATLSGATNPSLTIILKPF